MLKLLRALRIPLSAVAAVSFVFVSRSLRLVIERLRCTPFETLTSSALSKVTSPLLLDAPMVVTTQYCLLNTQTTEWPNHLIISFYRCGPHAAIIKIPQRIITNYRTDTSNSFHIFFHDLSKQFWSHKRPV